MSRVRVREPGPLYWLWNNLAWGWYWITRPLPISPHIKSTWWLWKHGLKKV